MSAIDRDIPWSDFFAIGDPEMDEEHRQFIKRMNEFDQAIVERWDDAAIGQLMTTIMAEATRHFDHEQQLLEKWNYPEAQAHAEKHSELATRLAQAMQDIQHADDARTRGFKGRLIKQLLVEHLLQDDMEYRDFLQAQERSK
jgi:hemerythrin